MAKELVRGHPRDGGFVLMEDADFDKGPAASSRAIDVVQFVDAAEDQQPHGGPAAGAEAAREGRGADGTTGSSGHSSG